ncbi:MAG: 2-oxo acid dehydrogenase subunit E2 [Sphingomonadales bacterium]|nr:2-oxo acid dehydrogenase subunit E2 [Sphingomonadales bacterium]
MGKFVFKLPDIGEGIAEAEIVAWHVAVGDRIEEDQPLADMMTDKATVEMESPVAGIVTAVAGEAGDVIAIGSMLVEIQTETEGDAADEARDYGKAEPEAVAAPEPSPPPQMQPAKNMADVVPVQSNAVVEPETMQKITASPAVRARARDLGVDLNDVKASGGHIRHADLDAYLNYGAGQGYRAPGGSAKRVDETIKVIGMRRRIAENMAASKRHIPHFSYVEEFDVTAVEGMRADLNANRGNRPKLTMLPFLIVAICKALPDFPMINARYDDEAGMVTRHGSVHLGMATQTDAGLVVPVIRDAQDRNVWQLAQEIVRLAGAVRNGSAKSEELSGSTLTITSLGPLGGIATTPVINRPEVAIIGPNKIVERPMFVGDTIEARKLMNLSISCDHRVVDGWDAASFVQAVKKLIETPVLLFAD